MLDMVKLMIAQVNLLISYQGYALLTVNRVLNQVPSRYVSSTPYELRNKQKSNLRNLQPQGSTAYVHNPSYNYGKLGLDEGNASL